MSFEIFKTLSDLSLPNRIEVAKLLCYDIAVDPQCSPLMANELKRIVFALTNERMRILKTDAQVEAPNNTTPITDLATIAAQEAIKQSTTKG